MLGTTSGRIRSAARAAVHFTVAVLVTITSFSIGTLSAPPAGAALDRTGPMNPDIGYPSFYGDTNGLRLQQCLDNAPICGPLVLELPNPNAPVSYPDNFPIESFYWLGETTLTTSGGSALLVMAMEGSWLNEEIVDGEQITFNRLRVRIDVSTPGSYTVTHPFGTKTYNVVTPGIRAINDTIDVGCFAANCNFPAALPGPVGPFLTWDTGAPAGYIGDPTIDHTVVGSPVGTNFFRIDGPNIGGVGVNSIQTNLFSVMGKLSASTPGAAGPLSAVAGPSGGQITLSWSPPADDGGSRVVGYRVFRGTATGALTFLADVNGSTTFTDSGLPDNATRFYAVSARNAVGEGPIGAEARATTFTRPGAPSGASAAAGPGAGQVTVSWNPPATTGSGPLTGYRVYRGNTSGALSAIGDVAPGTTSFTDSGLPEGASRFYAVTAIAAAGEGLRSNEASATTFSRPTAPLSASATSGPAAGQLTVSWSAPAATGGSPITGYNVYGGSSSGALALLGNVPAAARSFSETGLGNGTTKFYAVAATNLVGEGLRSNEATATTFVAPGAPSNLSVTAGPAGGQLSLTWVAPSTTGGSGATSYRVYRAAPGGTLAAVATVTGGATSFTDSGLGDAATFTYAVSGINAVGEGPQSATATATTFSKPSAPRAVTATAGPAAGQVTIGWTDPASDGGSTVSGYRVYRSVTGGTPVLIADVSGVARSFTDAGLPEGATRSYFVTARNAAGEGVASTSVNATTFSRPGAPQGFTATPGVGSVSLQWTAPANTGGSAITAYRVYAGPSAADLAVLTDLPASARSFVESGLAEATNRTYAVSALNIVGEGVRSPAAVATTFARPSVPQNVTGTAGPSNGAATITWAAPASDGGTAITNYRVMRGTSASDLTLVATLGNAARSFSDSGLPEGATRVYTVLAANAVGDGLQSAPVSVTSFARPNAPAGFNVSSGPGNGELTLRWLAPSSDGGRSITGYRIYRGTSEANLTLVTTVGATATSYVDSALPEGATRYYAVTAINGVGESFRTSTLAGTVFARPTAPQAVTAIGGPSVGRATVTWSAPASDGGRAVTGYRIYRSTLGSPWTLVGTVSGSTNTFSDAGLALIGIHHYRVTAVNGVGESVPSAESCALALPIPVSMPCNTL